MNGRLQDLVDRLEHLESCSAPAAGDVSSVAWLSEATDAEAEQLLAALLDRRLMLRASADAFLSAILHQLRLERQTPLRLTSAAVSCAARIYCQLAATSKARCYLLQLLAGDRGPEALSTFAGLVAEDPPRDGQGVGLAFGPLFQDRQYDAQPLFPRLLDATVHPSVAATVVDLCNFVTRAGMLPGHPAVGRTSQLAGLLSELVRRLSCLEEEREFDRELLARIARQVEEGVALAVSLCDALALIGDSSVVGKLYQTLELRHRRLRTEAAAALARLGEEAGRESLVALAAEPVCRLRVIAYAEELGLLERIDEEYRVPAARAEGELALWLAQPGQLGFPPTRLEVVDARTQYWPGFDEPVDCYLVRFVCDWAGGQYSNIGITGPLTHVFLADLADLPPDDIYAAFAGWHVQHEDIYETDVDDLHGAQRVKVARLERQLRDSGYEAIQPLQLAHFLGQRVLVAQAVREGNAGMAVADGYEIQWYPSTGRQRPISAVEAGCIYRGRKLLRAFNE